MNKYIEADKDLAELLGWTEIEVIHSDSLDIDYLQGIDPAGRKYQEVWHWTRNNAAAFELMCEYGIDVEHYSCFVKATNYWFEGEYEVEDYDNHESKQAAARFAIVQAVIAKLKGK